MPAQHVFISYKSEEVAYARELVQALEAVGIDSWAAFKDVRLSHAKEIKPAIQNASAVVILMSSRAYASSEVLDEVYLARKLDRLRLHILLPGEVDPFQLADLPDDTKSEWDLELGRRQYQLWGSAKAVAAWVVAATAQEEPKATTLPASGSAMVSAVGTADGLHAESIREPLALISSLGLMYQLDAINGLGENLLHDGDRIASGDVGQVVLAPDGSVIATANRELEVAIWTHDFESSLRGPALQDVLPPGQGRVRLLAIERPIGQAIRIIAARGGKAYSVLECSDGTWAGEEFATGDEEFVAGAALADNVLLLREGGDTVWAGDQAKRPFGLRSVRGIDSAFGPDGKQYLAGWGTGIDGSSQVEAVVQTDGGWKRIHRGSGERAGIVRRLRDAANQASESIDVAIAVHRMSDNVELVSIEA